MHFHTWCCDLHFHVRYGRLVHVFSCVCACVCVCVCVCVCLCVAQVSGPSEGAQTVAPASPRAPSPQPRSPRAVQTETMAPQPSRSSPAPRTQPITTPHPAPETTQRPPIPQATDRDTHREDDPKHRSNSREVSPVAVPAGTSGSPAPPAVCADGAAQGAEKDATQQLHAAAVKPAGQARVNSRSPSPTHEPNSDGDAAQQGAVHSNERVLQGRGGHHQARDAGAALRRQASTAEPAAALHGAGPARDARQSLQPALGSKRAHTDSVWDVPCDGPSGEPGSPTHELDKGEKRVHQNTDGVWDGSAENSRDTGMSEDAASLGDLNGFIASFAPPPPREADTAIGTPTLVLNPQTNAGRRAGPPPTLSFGSLVRAGGADGEGAGTGAGVAARAAAAAVATERGVSSRSVGSGVRSGAGPAQSQNTAGSISFGVAPQRYRPFAPTLLPARGLGVRTGGRGGDGATNRYGT